MFEVSNLELDRKIQIFIRKASGHISKILAMEEHFTNAKLFQIHQVNKCELRTTIKKRIKFKLSKKSKNIQMPKYY